MYGDLRNTKPLVANMTKHAGKIFTPEFFQFQFVLGAGFQAAGVPLGVV